jgi:ABC-type glycerol-3-phosphate transport system substrate-binding protein
MPLSRRQVLGAGLGAGALLVAGGPHRPSSLGVNGAAVQEPVVLRFWTPGGSPIFCDAHNAIAADYTAMNPGVTFEPVQCGVGEMEDFIQVLLAAIASGQPPDATILWDTPVSLAVRGALAPIDELMAASTYAKAENWPAGFLASCQFDGVTYGLPVTAGMYGMWYNVDALDEKGIPSDRASFPKTWDELRELSKEFVQIDGGMVANAGFIPIGWNYEDNPVTLEIWAALNGGSLYDAENQTYTIDSEPVVATMDYMVSWLDEQFNGDINMVRSSWSWNGGVSDEGLPPAFQAGHQAFMEQGSWMMGDYAAEVEPVVTNWNIAPYPVGPGGEASVSGYWPNWLAIPQGSPHIQEAFAYLDYLSGPGVEKWFSAVVDIPVNTEAPELIPQVVIDARGEEFAAEIMQFWADQAAIATSMWNSPIQNFSNDQLTRALERIMTKQATPQEALAEAQAASQAELESVLAG